MSSKSEIFKDVLIENSDSATFEDALDEWDVVDILRTSEVDNHCICTQEINDRRCVKHIARGHCLVIGNCCINKFGSDEWISENKRIERERTVRDGTKAGDVYCSECHVKLTTQTTNHKTCYMRMLVGIQEGDCKDRSRTSVGFGKYKNDLIIDVFQNHPGYVAWAMGQDHSSFPKLHKLKLEFAKLRGPEQMCVGKHNGKTFDAIFDTDKKYVDWVMAIDRPTGQILNFKNYIVNRASGIKN